ncbi:hypothetical protein BCR35DRAFT_311428 [Leucosporidium creatinivorum]|uniref:VanZ-like domain-containing protein n=1 Tax=Leucosporidium creatinivorum TaxID=106004 RepID=A0A1Y2BZH7_9BASI|nr:hypothetical protein BCR35DRAFT_311428 [Leucosporidium creatinivorum]
MARGRIRLSTSTPNSPWYSPFQRVLTKLVAARTREGVSKAVMKSYRVEGAPLRVRPALILLVLLTLLLLSLLGFHPTLATHLAPPSIPFSDKVLHFFAFLLASFLFYGIWLVDESARRVVWWRWWNEALSLVVCTGFGGVGSEVVQGWLPYKTFQWGDIVANLLGSTLGIYLAHRLSLHHRRQAEIRRLYQPVLLSSSPPGSDSDDSEGEGEELGALGAEEMEEGRVRAEGQFGLPGMVEGEGERRASRKVARVEDNPWDEDEESLFGVGEDEDEDEGHSDEDQERRR